MYWNFVAIDGIIKNQLCILTDYRPFGLFLIVMVTRAASVV
jgi:hypothetical protein